MRNFSAVGRLVKLGILFAFGFIGLCTFFADRSDGAAKVVFVVRGHLSKWQIDVRTWDKMLVSKSSAQEIQYDIHNVITDF